MTEKYRKLTVLIDCDGVLADFQSQYLRTIEEITGERFATDVIDKWDITTCQFFVEADERHRARQVAANTTGDTMKIRALKNLVESRIENQEGWCANIPPYAAALRALPEIMAKHDVYVVTSPWHSSKTWMHERTHWLNGHFGISPKRVIHAGCKKHVKGDVFIDDKPEHVLEWADNQAYHGPRALLFTQPYNRHVRKYPSNMHRAYTWEDVLGHINEQAKK